MRVAEHVSFQQLAVLPDMRGGVEPGAGEVEVHMALIKSFAPSRFLPESLHPPPVFAYN